jgi:hypothetical protein
MIWASRLPLPKRPSSELRGRRKIVRGYRRSETARFIAFRSQFQSGLLFQGDFDRFLCVELWFIFPPYGARGGAVGLFGGFGKLQQEIGLAFILKPIAFAVDVIIAA